MQFSELLLQPGLQWKGGKFLVDGSVLEGGGQILRNSIALASILKKSGNIVNIRGKRSKPGLRAQHATGLQLMSAMHSGTLIGAEVGKENGTARSGHAFLQTFLLPYWHCVIHRCP